MKPPVASVSQIPGNEPETSQAGAIPVVDGKVQYNPVLNYDRDAQVVLVQIIDPSTGEVERQYPSEKQIEAYQKAMEEQDSSLPELTTPEGLDNGPAGELQIGYETGETRAPTVNGGPDVDPGEVSLVA